MTRPMICAYCSELNVPIDMREDIRGDYQTYVCKLHHPMVVSPEQTCVYFTEITA